MNPSRVSIRCFGGVALEREGVPIAGRATQRRRLALVLFLSGSHARPVSRERLTAYLWPESDEEPARHLLASAVYELRKALGDAAVLSRGDDVLLDTSGVDSDVAAFETAVAGGRASEAIALYRGPFAEGFHLSAAPEFERWLEEKRSEYRRMFRHALELSARGRADAGDAKGAADLWLRSAAEDPADSRVLLEAMRALDAAGNRTAALKQASIYEAFVRGEFGAEPASEVSNLAEAFRRSDGAIRVSALGLSAAESPAPGPRSVGFTRFTRFTGALWIGGLAAAAALAFLGVRFARPGSASTPASSGAAVVNVLVLPFAVNGGSAAVPPQLGAGFADLLSAGFDGMGTMRAVRLDSEAKLYVTGTLLLASGASGASGAIRARAELRDRGGARDTVLATATAEGTSADAFALVDAIGTQLLGGWLSRPADRLAQAAARSTTSLVALKEYLAGEEARRRGRVAAAAEAFGRAVAADSSFALAHYRLSMMTLAADLPLTFAIAADKHALRHSLRLPDRDRLLIRAYASFRIGDADHAEQIYAGLLATYPDDVEAWRQLGETQFHYNPLQGRPIAQARTAFEHVLEHEPDDWDALWHLVQLDAIEGRDGDARRRIERLHAFGPAPPQALELRMLRALLSRDAREEAELDAQLRRADAHVLHQIVWRSAVYAGDLAAAERIARSMTDASRPRSTQHLGRMDLAVLNFARGQWRAADAELAVSRGEHLDWHNHGMLLRLFVSPIAVPARSRSELLALRDSAATMRPGRLYHAVITPMLVGLFDVALGDTIAAARRVSDIERLVPRDTAGRMGQYVWSRASAVRGAIAGVRGDTTAMLTHTEAAVYVPWFGFALSGVYESQSLERFARAEALRAAGRHRAALDSYASFGEHSLYDLAFLGPSLLRRAELYEKLGEPARAAEHYARFVDLWRDCDAELRPLRDAARAKLDSLR